jgi:MFS family permease
MQVVYLGNSMAKVPGPQIAMRFTIVPAGETNGFLFASGALGAFIGSLAAGVIADAWGFGAILWFGALIVAAALIVILLWLAPKWKYLPPAEHATAAVAPSHVLH